MSYKSKLMSYKESRNGIWFSLKLNFLLLGTLGSVFIICLSWVGTPAVYSFPRDLAKLKGNVKFMYVYDHEVKNDTSSRHKLILSSKTLVEFYEGGSSILSEQFGSKSRVNEYFCKYDKEGGLVEMNSNTITDNIYSSRYKHKYDASGRVIESIIYHGNEIEPSKTTYKYLPNCEKAIEYIDDKNLYSKTKIDTLHYCIIDRDFSRFSYKKKLEYKEKDTVQERNLRKIGLYNKNMDITESYYYSANGSLLSKAIFEYDNNGYLSSAKTIKDGIIIHTLTHSYIYDKLGNWTTDSIFERDTLSHILIRRYEYY